MLLSAQMQSSGRSIRGNQLVLDLLPLVAQLMRMLLRAALQFQHCVTARSDVEPCGQARARAHVLKHMQMHASLGSKHRRTRSRCVHRAHSARRYCSTVVLSSEAGVSATFSVVSVPKQHDVAILQAGGQACSMHKTALAPCLHAVEESGCCV